MTSTSIAHVDNFAATEFDPDAQSLQVIVTSFGLLAAAATGVLAWQALAAVQTALF